MNRRAFALGAAMALLGNLVAVALRSYAEAAFLSAYGAARVPYLLIAGAGGFAAATLGYDVLSRRVQARTLDLALIAILGVTAAGAPAMLRAGVPPVVLVIVLIAVSQVVTLALWNRVAASVGGRDARRMLPRAGAAATLGGAIAGLGAGAVIPRLGPDALPWIGAVATVIAGAVCVVQARALAADMPGAAAPANSSEALGVPQQRLLRGLIAIALVEAIVSTVIDLQFASTLKAHFAGADLAIAVSLFYGGTNAVLFLLQIGAVPHLLVTRSLPFTMTIHPVLVIAGYAVFAGAPSLATIATTRTTDQVLHLATSRTSQELALSALPPGPRARWKVLLRGAIGPAGICLAGGALLLAGPAAISERTILAACAMTIAVVWGVLARLAARRFQVALAAPLGIGRAAKDAAVIDLDTLEHWARAAGSDDAVEAALARAALQRARVDASDLAQHLRHDAPAVRAALFEQVAREPTPSLRGELRAAVAVEDDDHAFARGLQALAIAGDDSALARGHERAALSAEIAAAVRAAEQTLRGGAAAAELGPLCARDPAWAIALVRARRAELDDAALTTALRAAAAQPEQRAGALAVIARLGPPATQPILVDALIAGEPAAAVAIASLADPAPADVGGDPDRLAFASPELPVAARLAIARALAGAPRATPLLVALIADREPEVVHAALRTALALASGGADVPREPIAHAHDVARQLALELLALRDRAQEPAASVAGEVRRELEIALRRCIARLLWASAIESAIAGRDPAPIAAAARHLLGSHDADRRRALDVVQELATERPALLGLIERWLAPPVTPAMQSPIAMVAILAGLNTVDPWLGRLAMGQLGVVARWLTALRACELFASIEGTALAALAAQCDERTVEHAVFTRGDAGSEMYVVMAGELIALRDGMPERRIGPGGVVGEVAVLSHAPRASTVVAGDGGAWLLVISREAFAAAARRSPELVLGLSATLASWLAPNHPDVL